MDISATSRYVHSWNAWIWHYINIELRYVMKTELLHSAFTAQTTSNVQTILAIQMIHLAFNSEHSMNILTWTFIKFSSEQWGDHFQMFEWTFLEYSINVTVSTGLSIIKLYCSQYFWVHCRGSRTLEFAYCLTAWTTQIEQFGKHA